MSEATKHDKGKAPMSMLPYWGLEEIAQVLAFGAKKYGRDNWRQGMEWSRMLDAALRHLHAMSDGELLDPESGLPHAAHAGCCVLFLLDYIHNHPECNDILWKVTAERVTDGPSARNNAPGVHETLGVAGLQR